MKIKAILLSVFLLFGLLLSAQTQNTKLSQGLLLSCQSGANSLPGTNLVTNGTFDTDTDWTVQSGWSIANGIATHSGSGTYLYQDMNLVNGTTYNISCTVLSGSITIETNVGSLVTVTAGSFQKTFVYTGNNDILYFYAANDASIDNIVVRQINVTALTTPNPAYSLTNTGAVPTYGHKGNASYLSFDGVNSKITGSDATFPSGSSARTIIIRMKAGVLTDAYGTPFAYGTLTSHNAFMIAFNNTTRKFIVGSYGYNSAQSNTTIPVDQEFTLGVVFDGTQTITFYYNGVADGSVTLAGINTTLGSFSIGDIIGDNSQTFNGSIYSLRIFNYALSASDVTYYSNPANHLKAVDQGATGVSLVTGDNSTFASDTDWWTKADGNVTIADGVAKLTTSTGDGLYKELLTVGKKYNATYTILNTTLGQAKVNVGGNLFLRNNGTYTEYADPATTIYFQFYSAVSSTYQVDNVSIVQAGCLLDLTAESFISPTLIRDWYHSVDIALTGATAPRLVRQGNLSAWRFDGSTSYLEKTSANDGLTGDLTMSFWLFSSGIVGTYGDIFFGNTKLIMYYYSDNKLYLSRNAGSTTISYSGYTHEVWRHIVFVSTSSGMSYLYINGVLQASGSCGTPESCTTYRMGIPTTIGNQSKCIIEGLTITKGIWSQEQISLAYSSYQE